MGSVPRETAAVKKGVRRQLAGCGRDPRWGHIRSKLDCGPTISNTTAAIPHSQTKSDGAIGGRTNRGLRPRPAPAGHLHHRRRWRLPPLSHPASPSAPPPVHCHAVAPGPPGPASRPDRSRPGWAPGGPTRPETGQGGQHRAEAGPAHRRGPRPARSRGRPYRECLRTARSSGGQWSRSESWPMNRPRCPPGVVSRRTWSAGVAV